MPQPTRSDVHLNAILTNMSVAYMQKDDAFIADTVFPIVPVDKQSDSYYVYTKNDWFRDEAERRGDAAPSTGSGYNLSTSTYAADVWAFHKMIGSQARANADSVLNLDREAMEFVTQRLRLRKELQFVTDFFTTSVWGTDYTGVASGESPGTSFRQWNDFANSDPLEDIEFAKETILSTTGQMANTLVLGYQVARKLKNHPDLVDRIKYTSSQTITSEMMARLFDVDRVLVARAVKATNNEGQTGAYAFAYGKGAWLGHVAPNPGLLTPSAGYQFSWTGVSGGLGTTIGISKWYEDKTKADYIEGEIAFDNKVIGADLGVFMPTAVA